MNGAYREVQLGDNTYMRAPASTGEDLESGTRTNREAQQEFGNIPDWKRKQRAHWASEFQDELDSF